jgi:hypothetical protein
MKRSALLVLILISASLAGCEATHLVYVHETNLGVVLTPVSTEGTSKFSLGFDRETYALIPQKEGDNSEAMSLASVSRIKVKGLGELKFGHVVATGAGAVDIAKSAEILQLVQQRLFDEQEKSELGGQKQ